MDKKLKPGVPCDHPGCCHHVSHPCEKCGRIKCGIEYKEVKNGKATVRRDPYEYYPNR